MCVYVCMCVSVYVCMCVCVYVCMYVCMYVCVCVFIYLRRRLGFHGRYAAGINLKRGSSHIANKNVLLKSCEASSFSPNSNS